MLYYMTQGGLVQQLVYAHLSHVYQCLAACRPISDGLLYLAGMGEIRDPWAKPRTSDLVSQKYSLILYDINGDILTSE